MLQLWKRCIEDLSFHLTETHISTWVLPLHAVEKNNTLVLLAPNQHGQDWINANCISLIKRSLPEHMSVTVSVGSVAHEETEKNFNKQPLGHAPPFVNTCLNPRYSFANFVEGNTNQLACAAAKLVAQSPGRQEYNPLFIYGGVGLGKTHLVHALGNAIVENYPQKKVLYLYAETFVHELIAAIGNGSEATNQFKKKYRSFDALLVDDIQFFVGKKHSQEEFFHTFNTLFENGNQIVLTSDKYPNDIDGLPPRLTSRFIRGLAQGIEPPEYETRVAILSNKAKQEGFILPDNVLSFIAKQIHSNVRKLEGALRSVITYAQFAKTPITLSLAEEALKDWVASNNRQVSLENIQKTTCLFFKVRLSDFLSPKRSRSIVRPRQIAMSLSRELTNHSLPEIGEAFGGRDHTTVLNACRRIHDLKQKDPNVADDYNTLLRMLCT